VLVMAVSRDAEELPLRRVYALGPGSEQAELLLVGALPPAVLAKLRLQGVMGSATWGGLYFLRQGRRTPGPLLADFARGRQGMAFGSLAPSVFRGLDDREPARTDPQAVRELAGREFPVAELAPDLEARLGAGR
jgi:hypothetical protein